MYNKVKGDSSLVRDTNSKAILSRDKEGFAARVKFKSIQDEQEKRLMSLENKLDALADMYKVLEARTTLNNMKNKDSI